MPAYSGSAGFPEKGFAPEFRRNSTSDGTRSGTRGSAPPNIKFSPAASKKLLTILKGPGPFHPAIAWVSKPTPWHADILESITADDALLRATPRDTSPVEFPWI